MTSPSSPTVPGSHSRGLAYKQGIIVAVDGNIAYVRTTLTETIPVRRDIMRAKGVLPEVGETWLLTREFGPWHFSLIVIGGDKPHIISQSDVEGLTEILGDHDERLDHKDDQVDLLSRWVYSWNSLSEAAAFGNGWESLSVFSARDSVPVGGAGRYVNFGFLFEGQPITGVRVHVTGPVASSTILLGLYKGPIDNMIEVATASVGSASAGLKTANWSTPQTTVDGEHVAVGLATTASSSLTVAGCDTAIIGNTPRAQVSVVGGTSLLSTLVMGPTTPHSSTQARHWVGLF